MNRRPNLIPAVVLIGLGLLLLACGIYGLTQPDEFRAYARIRVAAPDCECLVSNDQERQELRNHLREYYTDLVKTIPPEAVLSNVTAEFNLNLKWNCEGPEAIRRLRQRLDVRLVQNTFLIEIGALGGTPSEAAQVANAVVTYYQQWESQQYKALVEAGIKELDTQLTIQNQRVHNAEIEVTRLKTELDIPSPEPSTAELRTNYPAFLKATRYLDDERDVQRLLARKINIEKSDLETPHNFLAVEIIERAIPRNVPLRRKKALSNILITAGLIGCGWALRLAQNSQTENTTA